MFKTLRQTAHKNPGCLYRFLHHNLNGYAVFHFCLQQIEARLIAHMESAEVEDIDSQEYEFEFGQLVHL